MYFCFDSLKNDITKDTLVRGLRIINYPSTMDVKEQDIKDKYIISNCNNILKINVNKNYFESKIKIADIYGDIYEPEYIKSDNIIEINTSYLSTGIYFVIADSSKPIKFIKY